MIPAFVSDLIAIGCIGIGAGFVAFMLLGIVTTGSDNTPKNRKDK